MSSARITGPGRRSWLLALALFLASCIGTDSTGARTGALVLDAGPACNGDAGLTLDAGQDAAIVDAGSDAAVVDAGTTDARADAGSDASADASADAGSDAGTTDAYVADAHTPDAYTPDSYTPDAYTPDAYTPDAYTPDAYTPDAYTPPDAGPGVFSCSQIQWESYPYDPIAGSEPSDEGIPEPGFHPDNGPYPASIGDYLFDACPDTFPCTPGCGSCDRIVCDSPYDQGYRVEFQLVGGGVQQNPPPPPARGRRAVPAPVPAPVAPPPVARPTPPPLQYPTTIAARAAALEVRIPGNTITLYSGAANRAAAVASGGPLLDATPVGVYLQGQRVFARAGAFIELPGGGRQRLTPQQRFSTTVGDGFWRTASARLADQTAEARVTVVNIYGEGGFSDGVLAGTEWPIVRANWEARNNPATAMGRPPLVINIHPLPPAVGPPAPPRVYNGTNPPVFGGPRPPPPPILPPAP